MGERAESCAHRRRSVSLTALGLHKQLTTTFTGYLYNDFTSEQDYHDVLAYAHQLGVVRWENATRKLFFGTNEGHERIKGFIERRKAMAGSQQQQQAQQQGNGQGEWEDYY